MDQNNFFSQILTIKYSKQVIYHNSWILPYLDHILYYVQVIYEIALSI